MQYQLPLMCVLNAPRRVADEVVNQWMTPHDAIVWAFENRDSKGVKTKVWMAQNLGMRTQHVTRLLKIRDLKLDPIQAHVWDCLTGWTACEQFKQAEVKRIAERAAADLVTYMQVRAA